MRRLLLLAAALSLAACSLTSLPGVPHKQAPTSTASAHHCADLVALAIASADQPVAGSFACLAGPQKEQVVKATGLSGDAAFQAIAKAPPVYTSAEYLGATRDGGFVYVLEGATDNQGKPLSDVLVLWTGSHGEVVMHQFAGRQ